MRKNSGKKDKKSLEKLSTETTNEEVSLINSFSQFYQQKTHTNYFKA